MVVINNKMHAKVYRIHYLELHYSFSRISVTLGFVLKLKK